jgi:UDP-3-O-[3-hydroxymyristoyl] glucosamine N-acyltransferase
MARLSELCGVAGWNLVRESEVASLGFIDIPLDGRLVFVRDHRNLGLALRTPGIAAILTMPVLAGLVADEKLGLATTSDPVRAFVALHNRLAEEGDFYGPWQATVIDPTAAVHEAAHVDPRGVVVGAGSRVEAGAILLEGTELGAGVRVMSGAVIGSEGFQTLRLDDEVLDFRHAGRTRIGDRTTVLANAVIARAVFCQATSIGADCRIGNGAFVSHNCQIGDRTLIGHGAVLAGNSRVGAGVVIGPGAVCIDRLELGEGCIVTAGAVVIRDVPARVRVTGNPAISHRRQLRLQMPRRRRA